jgi:hypothetical protein
MKPRSVRPASECCYAGDRTTEDQRVNVVRALVSVHDLQVHQVPRDTKLVADAVATEHVARGPGNLQRLAATVTLHDAGDLDCGVALILQATQTQAALQAERDVGEHVGEFLLHS